MRLLRVGEPGSERPAVLTQHGRLLDVSGAFAEFDAGFFADGGLDRVRELIGRHGADLPEVARDVRIGPPIARPGKVLCIGLNYVDHAAESGTTPPSEPVVFFKASNTVVGPYDDVLIPVSSKKTDWEVELAVVVGQPGRYLRDERAAAGIVAGYTISNDVSEREFQLERGGQWVKGKSCETFNPLGPWLATPDEVGDPQDLHLWLALNGECFQDSSTSRMVFGAHYLVWYLSQFMVLEPGDVINTGTPAGVGLGQDPPRYLAPGDVVELGIERLGQQRQEYRQAVP